MEIHIWYLGFICINSIDWQNAPDLAAKDFLTAEFCQNIWLCNLMIGFVLVHIPWKELSNLQTLQSYVSLRSELVLPSASTVSNICRREYSVTVDTIEKQLLRRSNVSLDLDGWTSTNKLARMSGNANSLDWHWALRELQLAFNEVESLIFS